MNPKALIADDEPLMREQLRARLAEAWPELEIVGEARNGIEAVEKTATLQPDLVFLDIRMPGMTGIEAARGIAALESGDAPEIVFVTAYDEYAIQAFEHGAVDYLLKPVDRERLAVTIERIRKRIAQREARSGGSAPAASNESLRALLGRLQGQLEGGAPAGYLKWIQAQVGQQIQMIPVEDVLFFISDEKYTRVQTAQLEALIRKPIKELIAELDPKQFWQIHRSTLVNARAIAGVSRDFRGRQLVAVKGRAEKLEVSRSYSQLFKGM
jgi:DNA-binding LytR/AlgR family response regulator